MKKLFSIVAIGILSLSTISGQAFAETKTDSSEAEIEFEGGDITLDHVPTLQFGAQEISSETVTYNSETLDPSLQVTDLRGLEAGWEVTAEMSNFKDVNEDGEENVTLKKSEITLSNGSVETNGISAPPSAKNPVVLKSGEKTLVVEAESNTGHGKWLTSWLPSGEEGNNNATLKVPAGSATAGNHTATITWTLNDTP